MKKAIILFAVGSFLLMPFFCFAAEKEKKFQASGEVISADPLYGRITIKHGAIKGFPGNGGTEFFLASSDLVKNIHAGDLVDFEIVDQKGDVKIDKITKVGVAPPKTEGTPLGQAVHDVLEGTGNVVKGVTEPIPPAHEVAKGVISVTDAGGDALKDAAPETKTKF